MSPVERERVITKMAYDLTGDGCDPVGKWLLRLPVQTPDLIKEGAFQVWLRTSNLGSASPRASRCPASLPRPILRLQRSLCSPLRSRVVWAISAASARHQRSVKDGGRHLGSLAALQRSEYQPQKPDPGTKSAPAALPLDTLYLRPHCQLVCRAQAGQDLPGRGEKDGSLTERLLPSPSFLIQSFLADLQELRWSCPTYDSQDGGHSCSRSWPITPYFSPGSFVRTSRQAPPRQPDPGARRSQGPVIHPMGHSPTFQSSFRAHGCPPVRARNLLQGSVVPQGVRRLRGPLTPGSWSGAVRHAHLPQGATHGAPRSTTGPPQVTHSARQPITSPFPCPGAPIGPSTMPSGQLW
ncbi:hypothetical protein NDU88_004136 [Pleurodeles waltl]|uniref:Uncharacterized protein n=1 Tax=Pleurodeles waltl TaxID=8319 RepID=A0AAV7V245_PLEWA|nr:hypothetical protein NDU88_004125 [Pleurodeles waltl]KAJ1194851.1 hypothetical protein NDU88_004136 [Pleurodeles waltl]